MGRVIRSLGAVFLAASTAGLLTACDPVDDLVDKAVKARIGSQEGRQDARIKILEEELVNIRNELSEKYDQRIATLEFGQTYLASRVDEVGYSPAFVSEGSYGLARTSFGAIVISVDHVQPYLDGFKATIDIGNPTTATFDGAEVEIGWGLPYGTNKKAWDEITKSKKAQKFKVTNRFLPASYTRLEVLLSPATAAEVKTLNIGIRWNVVMLNNPAQPQQPR